MNHLMLVFTPSPLWGEGWGEGFLRAVTLFFWMLGLAGSRPGGRVTFFASPKKVTKERRAEVRGPASFLALLASWGKFANLSAARPSDMRISDPHAAAL
ncbi:MAG: hypothetical protein CVU21_16775, partial [Betaproteobacteria bacterium HGW-Betaproteobacteria-15]